MFRLGLTKSFVVSFTAVSSPRLSLCTSTPPFPLSKLVSASLTLAIQYAARDVLQCNRLDIYLLGPDCRLHAVRQGYLWRRI